MKRPHGYRTAIASLLVAGTGVLAGLPAAAAVASDPQASSSSIIEAAPVPDSEWRYVPVRRYAASDSAGDDGTWRSRFGSSGW